VETTEVGNRMSVSLTKGLAIIGAGTMGTGIAQVAAQASLPVVVVDSSLEALTRSSRTLSANVEKLAAKGLLGETRAADVTARVTFSSDMMAVEAVDFIIEAIIEDLTAKQQLLSRLAAIAGPSITIGTNTSSISVTKIAGALADPGRLIGLHFFNPVPMMSLVEVVRGERTRDATLTAAVDLARKLGKTPVEVQDAPGFVSNRLLMPMINEAIFCLTEGVANREAIDEIMRLGMAHPMGPLRLADLIGLDVCLSIMETLQRDLGDDKYRPAPLLRRLVAAGKLGRKAHEGFYDYPAE
jgi:3-hydroxybutyryl-CoA dehydrogenase